jgi:hypothetical protein
VKPEYSKRWELEIRRQGGRSKLKKPCDLLQRAISSEDFVDSAVIGGVEVAHILAGKVSESQIPRDVLDAFHAQFPQHGLSFVDAVNHLSGDPERLMGLVNGVKGKLFEIDYAKWLNHGHLPPGLTAELAHHANNPAWDIQIHDAHGHISGLIQAKATETLAYVREAIAAHPSIPVAVPHELYERMGDHPELLSHLLDGHESLDHLTGQATVAADHADAAGLHFHFPIIAIAFAAGQNFHRYRKGDVTMEWALFNVGERSALAVIATGAGWVAVAATHATLIGIPVSMGTRMLGGQLLHNLGRRKLLDSYIETASISRSCLELQVPRPLLEANVQ